MRKLIGILFLLSSLNLFSATKIVKSTGGTYATIAQVNAALGTGIVAGDSVLFEAGETFTGTITASAFLPTSKIVFGKHGTGANPVISGFTQITAWTNLGSNIWESTNAVSTLTTCMSVLIGGTMYPMGKEPDTGYYTYQSHTTSSVTSSDLTGTPDWTGAEIALQLYPWTVGRCVITSQSGGTVTFTKTGSDASPYIDGQKFIIQNDARTLDTQNEWYFNPSTKKIRIYSTSQPVNVYVSSVSQLVTISGSQNLSFENLTFQGSNAEGISITDCDNIALSNCTIQYIGRDGISGEYTNNSNNLTIENCKIQYINNNGIDLTDDFTNAIIRSCTISNVGLNMGMTVTGSSNGNSAGQFIALNAAGAGSLVELNTVQNCGYHGIYIKNDNTIAQKNLVDGFCQTLTDGAGLYTWNGIPSGVTHSGMKFLNNIVLNGATDKGIYLDDATNGIEVKNNTVSGCNLGIYLHNSYNSVIRNNTIFDCNYGLYMYNNDATITMSNQPITANKFVAKTATQKVLYMYYADRIKPVYQADSNVYARPIAETTPFRYVIPSPYSQTDVNLSGWKTYIGQEVHSTASPIAISNTNDIFVLYNSTGTITHPILPYPCIDLYGNKVTSVTLQPFSSITLLKDPNPAPIPPSGSKFQRIGNKFIINPNNNKWQVKPN